MVRNLELLVMVCIADRFIMLTPMDLMITGIDQLGVPNSIKVGNFRIARTVQPGGVERLDE